MKRLEEIKGKIISIPEKAKRYQLVFWTSNSGWMPQSQFFTTPEDAVQSFLGNKWSDVEYYTVIEVELPIPVSK